MGTTLKTGKTLQNGKYTIVKSLGQGSFGITYLATTKLTITGKLGKMDTTFNVAIKEFFMNEMNSRARDGSSIEGTTGSLFINYRQKFRKEADNLSHLNHTNIVKVLDVFDENNTTYYVMQYIDGENLDSYILRQNGIQEKQALSILNEVGKALLYMHSHKMLHLDLKPKNIMLDKKGKSYLIDFGLSKQYTDSGEPESSTSIGAGTPGYAPIEQANYQQGGSFPTTLDVYALGATLFKMLTGNKPQHASELLEVGLDTFALEKKHVSPSTIIALQKAMAPIKTNRFQTIQEFLNALNNPSSFIEENTIYERQRQGFVSAAIHDGLSDATNLNEESTKKCQDEDDLRQLVEHLKECGEYKQAYLTCLQYIKENRCKAVAQELSKELVPLMKKQNKRQNRINVFIVTIVTIGISILSILLGLLS